MQFKFVIAFFATVLVLSACANQQSAVDKKEQASTISSMDSSTANTATDQFKQVVFDAKKDLVCGMPISAGVSDTLHYKDKVYGFCSKECKDEFVKNPSAYHSINDSLRN
jgi:YHS domain-containing protein